MDEDWVFVSSDTAADAPSRPDYLGEISDYIDSIADSLWPINKKIHDNPELGYNEHIAHEALTSFLKTQKGWKVTPSAYGMDTAFVAVFESGKKGPVVSFNAEMGMFDVCYWLMCRRVLIHVTGRCAGRNRPCMRPQLNCHGFPVGCTGCS
ncbi:hypothetical protein MPH_08617 [Macrophomina phaseolina MS6]|uniref:Uncharacterized protein n=1 Tax=Macrophomina phaseolina (strain MS6) TaxID=1126212 RepID=K2RN39_MACPH|nr:hypothetical protein MPH_08617 [Macrophomina phaseolina MS6]